MDNAAENGKLPEGWEWAKLVDAIAPSNAKIEPSKCADSAYLSLEHIEAHTGRIIGSGKGADVESTKAVFHAGDVLYGKLRPYLNKVCIPNFDGICSTDILVFPKSRCIENQFLMHFLMQPSVVEYANHNSKGIQLPRIAFAKLGELQVPVPPLAEQHRIVGKVEALLAGVNAARQRLAKLPAILKRFRQSLLAAACSGRLTADWRQEKPGVERHPCNEKEPSVLDEWSDLPEIPNSWCWTTLRAVSDYQGGYAYLSKRFTEEDTGNQVLRIGNVRPGYVDESISPVFINDEYAEETERFELQPNDILISQTGTRYKRDYGFVGLVRESSRRLFLNQRVARLRCNAERIEPRYVFSWLQTEPYRDCFFKDETGNVNQGNVGAKPLKTGPIPLPPAPEQHEIVRRVEALFRLADAIGKRVTAATARAEKLTQAILAKAFRGELVPTEAELARREGREYEPASLLLENVRPQQASTAHGRKTSRNRDKKENRTYR